jgi:uracil-DNA glycosylase
MPALANDSFLPTQGRVFAAFTQPLDEVRYVLVGEGPYPREHSATGVCFMDGAVDTLWSEQGLSKPVNRATSLRNFMKMLMVAERLLKPGATGGEAVAPVAAKAMQPGSGFIQTLPELQQNLTDHGFLLLNAACQRGEGMAAVSGNGTGSFGRPSRFGSAEAGAVGTDRAVAGGFARC